MNKKGVTMVEIIVTIVLISIVLLLFSRLLISLNKQTNESEESNTFKLNQSIVIRDISNVFLDDNLVITDITRNSSIITINATSEGTTKNVIITVSQSNINAKYSDNVVIINRNVPTGGKYLINEININKECVELETDLDKCVFLITIPCVDSNNNHFDLEIPGSY